MAIEGSTGTNSTAAEKLNQKTRNRVRSIRSELCSWLNEKAEYRRDVAKRAPEDANKNESYANSLESMVEFVEELPDDDPTLMRLVQCPGIIVVGEDCYFPTADWGQCDYEREGIHCGPRGSVIDIAQRKDWFEGFAELLIKDGDSWAAKNIPPASLPAI